MDNDEMLMAQDIEEPPDDLFCVQEEEPDEQPPQDEPEDEETLEEMFGIREGDMEEEAEEEEDPYEPDVFEEDKKPGLRPPKIPKDMYDKMVYDEMIYEKRWWGKKGPCKPSDKGVYATYGCYRNEFHKIDKYRRLDYAFPFADGTYAIVKAGDYSVYDGKVVTQDDIIWLHRTRNCEVERNIKCVSQSMEHYDLLFALEDEKLKKAKGQPNRVDEIKGEIKRFKYFTKLKMIVDDFGRDQTDHLSIFKGDPSIEVQLGLEINPLHEAIKEVMNSLPDKERSAIRLVHMKGLPRTTVAKMMGVSEGTIRYRLGNAEEKIRSHPFIARYWRIGVQNQARIEAWEQSQKEKKQQLAERRRETRKKLKAGEIIT